ncbi:MAG TPA: NUDIX hydrolase [Clostridiaceae bacterium]|nr:NUDIX hydrolase [Clostridiaceae bacterium]
MEGEKDKQFNLKPARVNTSDQADQFGSIELAAQMDGDFGYGEDYSQSQSGKHQEDPEVYLANEQGKNFSEIQKKKEEDKDFPEGQKEESKSFPEGQNEDAAWKQADYFYSPGEAIEDTVPLDPDLTLKENLIETDIKFVGRIFSVEVDKVLLSDGRHSRRELVRHPGGACVVAMDSNQYIYLVRQFRLAINRITLELPAGKLDNDEDPLSCAKRELYEEAGIEAENWRELTTVIPSPGYTDELISIYLAEDLTRGEKDRVDGEYVSLVKLHLHEAMKMVLDGSIMDAKTCIGVLLAAKLT